jgi:AAA domain
MWVERVELTSFGAITGESILFAQDKVNLVVEPNEYGKSTMATAIWAILFDFPLTENWQDPKRLSNKEARRPKHNSVYAARMDVNTELSFARRITIVRDFNGQRFKVFDRDKKGLEITDEFVGPEGQDELGFRLTGMTRELFLATCFIGQRELEEHAVGGASDLAGLVQSIADSSGTSSTAGQAIKLLTEAAETTLYGSQDERRVKLDILVRDLELSRQDLLNKIRAYERDRQDVAASFDRLMIINKVLGASSAPADTSDLETAQARLDLARSFLARKIDLERQMSQSRPRLESVALNPEMRRPLLDLFERRRNKQAEIVAFEKGGTPDASHFESLRQELKSGFPEIQTFTQEEAQRISGLATSLTAAEDELTGLLDRRIQEKNRLVKEAGSEEAIDKLRRSLKTIEGEGMDNARTYSSLIQAFQEQLKDGENHLHRTRAARRALVLRRDEEIKKRRSGAIILGVISVIAIIAGLVMLFAAKLTGALAFIPPMIMLLGLAGVGGVAVIAFPVFRQDLILRGDFAVVDADVQRLTGNCEDNINKINALEIKLDNLARKVGMANKDELLARLDEFGAHASKMKQLDVLEGMIEQKEQTLSRLRADLQRFLAKAGRNDMDIVGRTAHTLAKAISHYQREVVDIDREARESNEAEAKLEKLREDLIDAEQALSNLLDKMGIEHDRYDENKLDALELELAAAQDGQIDLSSFGREGDDQQLSLTLEQLQQQVLDTFAQQGRSSTDLSVFTGLPQICKELEDQVSRLRAEIDLNKSQSQSASAAEGDMRREREELLVRIRTLSTACDDNYLACLEDLDLTEFRLQSAKRAKLALELARDTLARISGENYQDWASRLNRTGSELLNKLGLDYDEIRFDDELSLIARRKSDNQEFDAQEIMSRLSIGTKEQLHWVARLIVARYLSAEHNLPIIMDEPFSEADDERFLKMMRFLVENVAKDHQIILFSCHKQRHAWLRSQLEEAEKGRLLFCRRQK